MQATTGLRILITGAKGYLANQLTMALSELPNVDCIVGLDPLFEKQGQIGKYWLYPGDVRDGGLVSEILSRHKINTIYHLAWVFNPTHDPLFERSVNFDGTLNILECAQDAKVGTIIYTSSATAYVDKRNTNEPIAESTKPTGTPNYPYSLLKAEVDNLCQDSMKFFENFVILRPAIVIGPHTRNIVSQMASLPVMIQIDGYDPDMQFCSEEDIANVLLQSLTKPGHLIVNVAGEGAISYSEVIQILGKKRLCLPSSIVYRFAEAGWRLRLSPFPSGILDLIRYPWVGDIHRLKFEFGYVPKYSSRQALHQHVAVQ